MLRACIGERGLFLTSLGKLDIYMLKNEARSISLTSYEN
jgi:hypothetical protein